MNRIEMKKSLGTESGRKAISSALDEIQKRCTVRTVTVEDMDRILEEVADRIGISKKALTGTKVYYTGAEKFPNAYRHIPESTHFSAEYNGKAWVVLCVSRDICPNRINNVGTQLSDTAKDAVMERLANMEI